VQLVLHAAALGEPGALYTLQMGDQLKLVDIARNLIRLSGFVPEEEIPIQFVGLRPGEKLSEELVASDETLSRSSIDHILRVQSIARVDVQALDAELAQLERYATVDDADTVLALLTRIVPTFEPRLCETRSALPRSPVDARAAAPRTTALKRRGPAAPPDRVFANRRSPVAERRGAPRGGRRLTDLIGLDAAARVASAHGLPAASPHPGHSGAIQ